jgi:hypothetical protein
MRGFSWKCTQTKGSHQEDGADSATNSVYAERVGIVALVGLLVQSQLVLEKNEAVAQRGANETHNEPTCVVDVASRRSDDDKPSNSSGNDP